MASDIQSGQIGAITPELILRSLISCNGDLPMIRANIITITEQVVINPIKCASFEDFMITLQRALSMGTDNRIQINVAFNRMVGSPPVCNTCLNYVNWYELAGQLFADVNGVICLMLGTTVGEGL